MKRVRILLALAVVIALITTVVWTLGNGNGDGYGIVASGTVEATTSDVGFAAGGRVDSVAVDEGDVVSPGDVLARLDVQELEARRAVADAHVAAVRATLAELRSGPRSEEVAQARAALAAAESRLADANRSAERERRLFAGGAVSREQLDATETRLDVARAQRDGAAEQLLALERGTRSERITAAEAQVRQAEAALEQMDALLANAVATAPFSGIVTVRHREPGEAIGAGAPVVTVMNPDDRWVRIYVEESDVARVDVGRDVRISVDGVPDETFPGRIVYIASEAEFTPRNVQTREERTKLVYAVRVRVTGDPAQRLKPGLPVDVHVAPASGLAAR